MRILYAVHGYKPAVRIGGPAVSVPALAERLVRRGHDVTVVTSDRDLGERLDVPLEQEVDVEGVRVWYFPAASVLSRWLPPSHRPREPGGFLYAPSMAEALQRIVPSVDLVHTHLPFIYPTYAAAKAARVAHKPLVYHQRGVLNPRRLGFKRLKKRIYLELIEKPILRQATLLLALTESEAASYRQLGAEQPCWTVPNGVDLPSEQFDVRSRARAVWALPEAAPVVLFLGRLHSLKGTRELLGAFREVHRVSPDARLVMAGPDEEGELSALRSLSAAFGLGDAVLFPGLVRGEQKALLLARADVFCLPSVAEGFSMAVLEAMAARTAVLLTPGCGFPEVVAAGAGRIVEDTGEGLQRALVEMLADPATLARMAEAGRALVERDYSWDRIVDRLLEAYTESIGLHRAALLGHHARAR
jgi:glycosyltransferase involved in cell wall biosynthesis